MVDDTSHPRLIYYSDAHHFHAKQLDPPLNLHKMRWPIDELAGTDQVREVIKRGRAAGIKVFPSLKLQDPSPQGSERCG